MKMLNWSQNITLHETTEHIIQKSNQLFTSLFLIKEENMIFFSGFSEMQYVKCWPVCLTKTQNKKQMSH